jgi:hypothetical protein
MLDPKASAPSSAPMPSVAINDAVTARNIDFAFITLFF